MDSYSYGNWGRDIDSPLSYSSGITTLNTLTNTNTINKASTIRKVIIIRMMMFMTLK